MTVRYTSRPHSLPGVSSEYQRAERDWTIWQLLFMVVAVAVLVLALWLARIGGGI